MSKPTATTTTRRTVEETTAHESESAALIVAVIQAYEHGYPVTVETSDGRVYSVNVRRVL